MTSTSVAHIHGPTVIAGCCNLVILDGVPLAAVLAGESVANRLAELLDRHGLADVPADTSELVSW